MSELVENQEVEQIHLRDCCVGFIFLKLKAAKFDFDFMIDAIEIFHCGK